MVHGYITRGSRQTFFAIVDFEDVLQPAQREETKKEEAKRPVLRPEDAKKREEDKSKAGQPAAKKEEEGKRGGKEPLLIVNDAAELFGLVLPAGYVEQQNRVWAEYGLAVDSLSDKHTALSLLQRLFPEIASSPPTRSQPLSRASSVAAVAPAAASP